MLSRTPNSNCRSDLETTARNVAISKSSLINAVNGFPRFVHNSTRELCSTLVPRCSCLRHYPTLVVYLGNALFWNQREILSSCHGLADTIKIPFDRKLLTGTQKNVIVFSRSLMTGTLSLTYYIRGNQIGKRGLCTFFLCTSSGAFQVVQSSQ